MSNLTDPTSSFLILKLLTSSRKRHISDIRLPITKIILHKLVSSLPHTTSSLFQTKLYKAMFLLAFHAFLRVGEITADTGSRQNNLLLNQIQFESYPVDKVVVDFKHFKHSNGKSYRLSVQSSNQSNFCPVHSLREYLSIRGIAPGPLFAFTPDIPVTRQQFNTALSQSLIFNHYDTSKYKSHSFRIGSATEASDQGLSDSQIRQLGRWRTDAFKTYIRSSQHHSNI
jgi:hypothetical protein